MKRLMIFALLAIPAMAATNSATATHHTIKPGRGLKRLVKSVPEDVVTLVEAAVDSVGVGLQLAADTIDMGVAAPLEAFPPPVHQLGVVVHVVYRGIDALGQELAE